MNIIGHGGVRRCTVIARGREPGRKLSFIEYGDPSCANTLVCIHALTHNALYFDQIATALSNEYRVISIDLPGRGDSDYLTDYKLYQYPLYISDILSLLHELNITTTDWIGSSMGGLIGIMMSAHRPKLIRRLILNDIGPSIPKDALDYVTYKLSKVYNKISYTASEFAEIMKRTTPRNIVENESLLEHVISYSAKIVDNQYMPSFDYQIFEALRYNALHNNTSDITTLTRAWQLVRAPILLMWGAKSIFVTHEIVKEMLDANKDLTICRCMQCSHVCDLMEKKQIHIIRQWLNGHTKNLSMILK